MRGIANDQNEAFIDDVLFQITSSSKTLLAHITLVRSLVRVNTHVEFQFRFALLAHITFIRFLVRVNTMAFF